MEQLSQVVQDFVLECFQKYILLQADKTDRKQQFLSCVQSVPSSTTVAYGRKRFSPMGAKLQSLTSVDFIHSGFFGFE